MLEATRPDELLLAEAAYDERTVLDVVQQAHRQGVKVRLAPNTTELLVHEGEYVPGQGVPLFELRPPILTGVDWAVKRAFDIVVSAAARGRACCRSGCSSRSPSSSTRAGRCSTSTRASGWVSGSSGCSSSARWSRTPRSSSRTSRS